MSSIVQLSNSSAKGTLIKPSNVGAGLFDSFAWLSCSGQATNPARAGPSWTS